MFAGSELRRTSIDFSIHNIRFVLLSLSNALQLWILDLITWSAIQDLGMSLLRKRKERDIGDVRSRTPWSAIQDLGMSLLRKRKKREILEM
jgi:hypothetical protein